MSKPISRIRNMSAEQLLKHCGQQDTIPVDLQAIMQRIDISCLPYDFSQMEQSLYGENSGKCILGALVTKGDQAAVFYRKNNDVDSHRYRFTVAHELAHCCLAHYGISGGSSIHLRLEGEAKNEKEIAANIFAGELLIPEKALRQVIKELIFPSVNTLAEIFAVSTNVMRARLHFLKVNDKILGYNC